MTWLWVFLSGVGVWCRDKVLGVLHRVRVFVCALRGARARGTWLLAWLGVREELYAIGFFGE